MRHITSVADFNDIDLLGLFKRVCEHKRRPTFFGPLPLERRILTTFSYEPSTGTRTSFEAAMYRLGGNVISIPDAKTTSLAKGETLEDAIRRLADNCDAIMLRHPENGAAERAAKVSKVSIINAGDGSNEHPTQALVDLFTIWEACKSGRLPVEDLRFFFYGDNKRGRAVRSLVRMLALYGKRVGIPVSEVTFGGAPDLGKPDEELFDILHQNNIDTEERYTCEVPACYDLLYVTRSQNERGGNGKYLLEPVSMMKVQWMPEHAIILHPLPRVDELESDVDADDRAWYFKQANNKLYVYMALLELLLKE